MHTRLAIAIFAAALLPARAAHAEVAAPSDVWQSWNAGPALLAPLVATGLAYGVGVWRLWAAARPGRGVRHAQVATFGAGLVVLVVALVSPLEALGETLFSAHMVQHLLLIVVAAPLLVLGAPPLVWLWALPASARGAAAAWWRGSPARHVWKVASAPPVALVAHLGTMWLWHLPVLFEAALRVEPIHALEHAAFLGTGVLFWLAVARAGRPGGMSAAAAVAYLFAAFVASGLLGMLLTFARQPWYASYAATTAAWGRSPLDDQQLAGLIMWVPAGLVYSGAAIGVFLAWYQSAERESPLPAARRLAKENDAARPRP